ncbi:hypothetical protein Fcan01_27367 [Folsomia candida]|uniref:Uncharacterized protein n=1 Tax=Folsomia candida TaxID=158441 RepID=A0A226CZT7_FOLCA|nr:hypothetical protein Fcan01_27367 [Folsomia candida]
MICIVFNDDLPRDIETLDFTHVPLITNVKSIFIQSELEAELSTGSFKDFCENIILTSSATLENLEFLWDRDEPYFPALRGTVFPKMKKFEVLYNLSQEIDDEAVEEVGHTIMECFPSLEYLYCARLAKIARPGMLSRFPT